MLIPIHVISLTRTPKRRERFVALNKGLRFQWFDAVDGLELPGTLPGYTPGATGCALSHRALWEQCVRSGEPLTVAEDDAGLHSSFNELAMPVAAWDIIVWGWNLNAALTYELLPGVLAVTTADQTAARAANVHWRPNPEHTVL